MDCCLGELCHLFVCPTESLQPLSKVSLNLRALVYNLIKTRLVGKYFMGIQSISVANPISTQRIQLKSAFKSRISFCYLWKRNLVSISLLADCLCWYFAGI